MAHPPNPLADRSAEFLRQLNMIPEKVQYALKKNSVEIRTKVIFTFAINILVTIVAIYTVGAKVVFTAMLLNTVGNLTLIFLIYYVCKLVIQTVKNIS